MSEPLKRPYLDTATGRVSNAPKTRQYVPHAITGEPVPVLTAEERDAQTAAKARSKRRSSSRRR